jgi:hypothetical protein
MATHDYVIANQSGAAFRTDLNNALAAIVSNNSNSSSPATTYAYQWWVNTTDTVLMLRNSSNDGWISLFELDGTVLLNDGTNSAPSLCFRDDRNTGIFSDGADEFNIATGGVERMGITSGAVVFNQTGTNTDFRVEGDTEQSLFFVDAGTEDIGIGTSSPTALQGDGGRVVHIAGDSNPELVLEKTTSGAEAKASIRITNNEDFVFAVQDGSGTKFDAINILSDTGLVGIGSDNPAAKLHVLRTTDNATGCIIANNGTTGGNCLKLTSGGTGSGTHIFTVFGSNQSGSPIEHFRVNADGHSFFGGTSANYAGRIKVFSSGSTTATISSVNTASGTNRHIDFFHQASTSRIGSIQTNSTSTAYNTTSDYRLKENASAISDGITRLKTLKPYRFNFIADPTKTVDGFFAHEVTAVPEAISGTKDGTEDILYNEDDTIPSGKKVGDVKETVPLYQEIDQSKLVPLLVAAVQELITKVETLEAA